MKTIKLISAILLIAAGTAMAKTPKPAAGENTYIVRIPHTQEQCMNVMNDLKGKGDAYLSKFWFGCMSGDHTAYGILKGTSEESVRNSLPRDIQDNAKIVKVDQFTAAQIVEIHKQMKK